MRGGRQPKTFVHLKCPQCGRQFDLPTWDFNRKKLRGYKIYCSKECVWQQRTKLSQTFVCKVCSKEFPNVKSAKNRKTCSRECAAKSLIGKPAWNKGKKWSMEHIKRISGANSPFWQGKTDLFFRLRRSQRYKDWRKAVFERDNYTCRKCGARAGEGKRVDLQADHIIPFAFYPEMQFELHNGRTLCVPCHKETPTYGSRANALWKFLGLDRGSLSKVHQDYLKNHLEHDPSYGGTKG